MRIRKQSPKESSAARQSRENALGHAFNSEKSPDIQQCLRNDFLDTAF
jgi:hypothetical protein